MKTASGQFVVYADLNHSRKVFVRNLYLSTHNTRTYVCILRRKKVGKEGKLGENNFSETKTGERYLKDWVMVLNDRPDTERLKNMSALVSAEK